MLIFARAYIRTFAVAYISQGYGGGNETYISTYAYKPNLTAYF